jgi:hypothetical protein
VSRDIEPREWREQRWKNDRGVTREVIRWPAGDGEYDVRVSFVELTEPGPFSTFPGYHRWTVLLDGPPLVLHAHGTTYAMRHPGAFQLDGATAVTAELPGGPTHVLNVIAKPNLVAVGTDTCAAKTRFVFAYGEPNELELPRWHARILEPRATVRGPLMWLYWLDWREDPHQPPRSSPKRAAKPKPRPKPKR